MGSVGGLAADQVYKAWSTAVKLTWEVPRATRTFLVQKVLSSDLSSAKVDIGARFANFFKSLSVSPCHEVTVMAKLVENDIRSLQEAI